MNSNPKINIKSAPGNRPGDTEGNDIINWYFQLGDDGKLYRLHHQDGTKIHTEPHHLTSGKDFTFTADGLHWKITEFKVWEDPVGIWNARGDWHAHDEGSRFEQGDPESGTFQAQSGGGADPELEASASASA